MLESASCHTQNITVYSTCLPLQYALHVPGGWKALRVCVRVHVCCVEGLISAPQCRRRRNTSHHIFVFFTRIWQATVLLIEHSLSLLYCSCRTHARTQACTYANTCTQTRSFKLLWPLHCCFLEWFRSHNHPNADHYRLIVQEKSIAMITLRVNSWWVCAWRHSCEWMDFFLNAKKTALIKLPRLVAGQNLWVSFMSI